MQQPTHFREERPDVMHALMRTHPLATLVTVQDGLPVADHIPMVLDAEAGLLRGHLAANNPLAAGADTTHALAIFQGPQAYVSAGWYVESKASHGRVVPTWNYISVHARGTLRVVRDADWMREHLTALSDTHEAGRAEPWAVTDAPPDYVAALSRAIVGLELSVEALQGTLKMSQNKRGADHAGVVDGLRTDGRGDVADVVVSRGR